MPAGQPLSNACTQTAIQLMGSGKSQTETGQLLGTSQQTMSALAAKHRKAIEQLTLDYIGQSIPLIESNHMLTLTLANKILRYLSNSTAKGHSAVKLLTRLATLNLSPEKILDLSDKKEFRALQIMGIAPSHTPGMVVNMLFQDNRTQIYSPVALEAASAYLGRGELDPDLEAILDAEVEDAGTGEGDNEDKQG